jgi:hypothetical protein
MVKLKVSFDKAGAKINENQITALKESLWGKTGSGEKGAFIPK